jgi:hypothetical protein
VSGDDVLEGFLVLHSIGATCVNAGANGIIDTTPVDDDYERVAHEGLFGTDPQKRDTDGDGLPDGREIMVGTNPNSKDAGGVTDTDGDGLYDIEEEKGWLVDGVQVHPNANRPDSDFDRIPDVIERAIGSHPLKMDTDDDGLLDHDEFDPENDGWEMPDGSTEEYPTVALQRALDLCDDAPNCNYNPPNDPIGSHPAREDSDGDGLEDKAELDGWEVTWTPAGGVQDSDTFFSDPTTANTDDDALLDGKEFALLTNPEDKDSDGDGTMDHVEVETCRTVETPGSDTFSCRNPLHADRLIRFLAYNLRTVGDCDDTCCNYSGAELAAPSTNAFRISSAFGNRDFGGGNIRGGCGDGAVNEGWDGRFFDNSDYGLGHVFYFLLKTGEQFDVVGQGLQECDDGAEDNDSLSLSPFSYNYTTSAAFPENVIQSATNSITGSGEGTCQFDFTIRFTPLAGCDADPDCPGDGNACTRDKCATASHTCTAEAITCTGSQSCNLGKCVAACTTTAQCGAGNVCHNGGCFTSCTTTCSDSSEECVSGACIPKDQN